jgi:phage-related protein (TIGR01555 family)
MPKKIVKPTQAQIQAVMRGAKTELKKYLSKHQPKQATNAFGPFSNQLPFGFPQPTSFPGTEQVSSIETLEANLRWFLISNFRQVLSEAYVELGLIQAIVDIPVDDAFRGGIELNSKQLSEDELAELITSMDRDEDIEAAKEACKWERLFGGAGIIVMVDDQDPEKPLNVRMIDKDTKMEFRAADLWELFWSLINTEGYDPSLQTQESKLFNYYGKMVHKSRVMKLKGHKAPSFIRPRLRGWGTSEVEIAVRSINQYLKGTDLTFEVLDEFKLDIYLLDGLATTLGLPNGLQKVAERVMTANRQKNYQNAVVLDAKDKYEQKQLSFAGLAEVSAGVRMQVASDLRMPLTKLFGISAAGFNSGEDDIEVYNGMIESSIRGKAKYHVLRMAELRCQQLFGFIPDDLKLTWQPLRVLSAVDEETVKTNKFTRLLQARQAGEITTLEFRERVNKDSLLGMPLEVDGDNLNPDDPEIEKVMEGKQDPVNPEDTDQPGVGRADQGKPKPTDKGGIAKPGSPGGKKGENEAPEAPKKPVKNAIIRFIANILDADWKEDLHPRDESGQFSTGGGGGGTHEEIALETPTPGQKKKGEPRPGGKKFKSFGKLTEPKRENSRTEELGVILGPGAGNGKASKVPYKSPATSTCNMVGFVAFGKSSEAMQKVLNESLQSSEVILSKLGVKFKTPLDFVCQNIAGDMKRTIAMYQHRMPTHVQKVDGQWKRVGRNSSIEFKHKLSVSKSLLHEIGHALDYAYSQRDGKAASYYYQRGFPLDEAGKELAEAHTKMAKVVKSSSYYTEADSSFKRYLNDPTEVFARAFEVYSYKIAQELAAAGEIPEKFVEDFEPDIFKSKDQAAIEVRKQADEIITQYNKMHMEHMFEKDPEKKAALDKEMAIKLEEYKRLREQLKTMTAQTGGWVSVPKEKQQEYTAKISEQMEKILAKDVIRNAITNYLDATDEDLENSAKMTVANPGDVNEEVWEKAKRASKKALGQVRWPFVMWWYKQHNGK